MPKNLTPPNNERSSSKKTKPSTENNNPDEVQPIKTNSDSSFADTSQTSSVTDISLELVKDPSNEPVVIENILSTTESPVIPEPFNPLPMDNPSNELSNPIIPQNNQPMNNCRPHNNQTPTILKKILRGLFLIIPFLSPISDFFSNSSTYAIQLERSKSFLVQLGEFDFKEIVSSPMHIYVDKTKYAFTLATMARLIRIVRPKRFGKSLMLSTIQYYFEGREKLFHNLNIMEEIKEYKKIDKTFNSPLDGKEYAYPVISINFALIKTGRKEYDTNINRDTDASREIVEKSITMFKETFCDELRRNQERLGIKKRLFTNLTDPLALFKEIVKKAADDNKILRKGERKVVVLIDELDSPLIDVKGNAYFEDTIAEILNDFYQVFKNIPDTYKYVMLMGVSLYDLDGKFISPENFDREFLRPEIATAFGYTFQEVRYNFDYRLRLLSLKNKGILTPSQAQIDGVPQEDIDAEVLLMESSFNGYGFSTDTPETVIDPISVGSTCKYLRPDFAWRESSSSIETMLFIEPNIFKWLEIVDNIEKVTFTFNQLKKKGSMSTDNYRYLLMYQFGFVSIRQYVPAGSTQAPIDTSEQLFCLRFGNDTGKEFIKKLLEKKFREELPSFTPDFISNQLETFGLDKMYEGLLKYIYTQGTQKDDFLEKHIRAQISSVLEFTLKLARPGIAITPEVMKGAGFINVLVEDNIRKFSWIFELKRQRCLGMGFIQSFFRKYTVSLFNFIRRDVISMAFPETINDRYNEWMGSRWPEGGTRYSEFFTSSKMSQETRIKAVNFMRAVVEAVTDALLVEDINRNLSEIECPFCHKYHVRRNGIGYRLVD